MIFYQNGIGTQMLRIIQIRSDYYLHCCPIKKVILYISGFKCVV